MFGFLVRWVIRSNEKKLGEPLDYLREMYASAPGAFWQFTKVAKAAGYRDKLPAAAFHVARLVAVRHQDCGPCVQTCVNLAKADGVEPRLLRAALDGKPDELPGALGDVYGFAQAVATGDGGEGEFRERLRAVFGPEALVELALAITLAQTYPVLKRGLGYAKSCSLVNVTV